MTRMTGVSGHAVRRTRAAYRHLSRRAREAIRARREDAAANPPAASNPVGMVGQFERRQIAGWISADASAFPVRISLHVNDLEVAATWADFPSRHNTNDATRGFRIAIRDIWAYCRTGDQMSVRAGEQVLPIASKGTYKLVGSNGAHTLEDLQRKFDQGYIFGQTGGLQLSKKLDRRWQESVLGLYRDVRKVLLDSYGYDPFVIYGTLLGLTREGGFIGHDVDFDAAYISKHSTGAEAARELRDIAFTLIDAGFDVECMRTALHIHDQQDPAIRIDLFELYFKADDTLAFPFGIAGHTTFGRADWTGLTDGTLAHQTVRVPVAAERLAEHIYGESWRTPIAGFNWDRARTAYDKEGRAPAEYGEEVYWANFYARHEMAAGSTFFELIRDQADLPTTVVDIGCGDGRDSFAFARAGRHVVGLDRSHIGIRHAGRKAETDGLADALAFVAADVAHPDEVRAAVERARERAGDTGLLFYLRFFLHSITEGVQDTLLSTLAELAHDEDVFAAEFRTDGDAGNAKVFGKHFRRYQNAADFSSALRTRYRFGNLVHEQEGAGLAPYGDEDPVLYRVIARRGPGAA